MDWQTLLSQLALAIIPAVVAYFLGRRRSEAELDKLKAETQAITVQPAKIGAEAAAALATGMSEFIDDLRGECEKLRARIDALRERIATLEDADEKKTQQIADLRAKLAVAERRIAELEAENKILKKTVKTLETENDCLRQQMTAYGNGQ